MKLRELTPADAPRCAELEEVLFPGETPWSSRIFREEMAQPFNFYFGVEGALDLAHESTVLLGYAGIGMMGPAADPEFEIHTIGVDPAAQRRGIARMIEEEKYCIDILTQVSALTRALQGVATGLLDDHLKHCVLDAAKLSDEAAVEKIQEATDAINRLVRS